jgi:plasmid stabilization system protein ParE
VKLIVSKDAAAYLKRLRAFLVGKDPQAAQRAVATIINSVRSLDVLPIRGRSLGGEMRELVPFGRSAYIIRYAYLRGADEVVILRIWHGSEERE